MIMLRAVLLPSATRYQLYSSAQKFPARTIKILSTHSGMLLQKKQLIKHYLECVFITKEKEGQEILRNATPNIFPQFSMLVKCKCGWNSEVTFWQMACSNWISADNANILLGGEDLNLSLLFTNSCRYLAIRAGFSKTYRTRNISWSN